jgi:hypothetical protein
VLQLGALPRVRDELLTVELRHLAQDLLVVLLLLRCEVVVDFLGVLLDLEFGVAARHAGGGVFGDVGEAEFLGDLGLAWLDIVLAFFGAGLVGLALFDSVRVGDLFDVHARGGCFVQAGVRIASITPFVLRKRLLCTRHILFY